MKTEIRERTEQQNEGKHDHKASQTIIFGPKQRNDFPEHLQQDSPEKKSIIAFQ
jgi:hypothetical protein